MRTVYLDNAATLFPKSPAVLSAMETAFNTCGNGGRGGHPLAAASANAVYECREALAELFGCEVQDTVLCGGATLALNMAVKGLYKKGGTVLSTTLEHNAVLRPLYALRSAGEIKLKLFSPSLKSKEQTLSAFTAALTKDVRMAVFTHASNVCGMCLPVAEMCAIAKERGIITVVDCAQTAGHIPVDIKELGSDVLCIAGHKGIGGPMGTGAMLIHPNRRLSFATLIEGGTGVASREKFMPDQLPERLEAGTANITGIAGLATACKTLTLAPEREEELRLYLADGLQRINGVKVYGAESNGGYTPIVLFNIEGISAPAAEEKLSLCGVYTRGGLHCAPLAHTLLGAGRYGAVRASLSKANSKEDCDLLIDAVKEIKAGKI